MLEQTAMGKAVICKVSCIALQECQEAMGGIGYMDEPDEPDSNISRLYRDTAANMTWEGTTNVLSSEIVRHLLNGRNLNIFSTWLEGRTIDRIWNPDLRDTLATSWWTLKQSLQAGKNDLATALADGRQIMFSLAWIVSGALLCHDAQRDDNATALEVAHRWVLDKDGGVGEFVLHDVVFAANPRKVDTHERLNWDCRLVWGFDLPSDASSGYRVVTVPSSGTPEKMMAKL